MKSKKLNILGLGFSETIADFSRIQEADIKYPRVEDLIGIEPYEFVVETLKMVKERFDRVYIISRCSSQHEGNIKLWLFIRGILGDDKIIPERNLKFCRENLDKAFECQRLGITHFIDDRLSVLVPMNSVFYKFQFGNRRSEDFESERNKVTSFPNWRKLYPQIKASMI